MQGEMSEGEALLSKAITVRMEECWAGSVEEVIATVQDNRSDARWIMLFFRQDRCFYIAVNGRERFRTDSPHLACAYFTERRPIAFRAHC